MSLGPDAGPHLQRSAPQFRLAFARMVTHYWAHACFLGPDQVVRDADRLVGIPAVLVHGRLDVSGPLGTAWRLHRAWPGSELVVLEDAGHGGESMTGAMTRALDRFRDAS